MGELIEYRIYDVDGKNHLSKKEFDKIHMTDLLRYIINKNYYNIKCIPCLNVWGEFDSADDLNAYS